MPGCASSTATATSTRTASSRTPTRSSTPPGPPASSGSSSPAGTSPRRNGRSTWPSGTRGSTPRSASTRTMRPRSTTAGWARIVGWATDPRVVAIGETGLDYDRVFSPVDDQLANLRRNLALALETGKPAILHCRSAAGRRDAQDALVAELRTAGVGGPAWAAQFGERPPAVIHSFSGPVDYAREVIDLGLAISFSGLVFRRGEEESATVAGARAGRAAARRDRFAVPGPAGRAALAQRAGVGTRHSGVGRGATRHDARRPRPAADRRLRPGVSTPREDDMTLATPRRLATAQRLLSLGLVLTACSQAAPSSSALPTPSLPASPSAAASVAAEPRRRPSPRPWHRRRRPSPALRRRPARCRRPVRCRPTASPT